ncbi:MAG: hypothetical protein KIS88_03025 [Anaerolineales bacterium]|nr:hypothetical protein [Anaerolineales bacterium]
MATKSINAIILGANIVERTGEASFEVWLTLSVDHLLPKGHPQRENEEYKVTACQFCNTAENRYFDKLAKQGLSLNNLSRSELVSRRLEHITNTRNAYQEFGLARSTNQAKRLKQVETRRGEACFAPTTGPHVLGYKKWLSAPSPRHPEQV